jgi:hypothetical protein
MNASIVVAICATVIAVLSLAVGIALMPHLVRVPGRQAAWDTPRLWRVS